MIKIANPCGINKETEKLLELIYDTYEANQNKDIYIYGNLINNEIVKQELTDLEIKFVNDISKITSSSIVIITNEGITKSDYDYLVNNNINFIEDSLESFKKIIDIINAKKSEHYEIVLLNNLEDKLVSNLNSWFNNECIVIEDESDYDKLSKTKNKFIISFDNTSNKYIIAIKEIYENLEVLEYLVDYYDREELETASQDLAKESDVLLVIDTQNSLINKVSHLCECYSLTSLEDLIKLILKSKIDIDKNKNIGITASRDIPMKEVENYEYLLEFLLFYKEKYQELKLGQDKINKELNYSSDNKIVSKVVNDFQDLNQDGKYIRGVLIALGEYLANNKQNRYLELAYAFEMFQTAVLIHDDIIDNAKLRRGKETIPRRICHEYLNLKNNSEYQKDTLKLANSIGICAGDLGFYEANMLIIKNYSDLPSFKNILEFYNEIIIKTIRGEIIDVYLPFLGKYNFQEIKESDILDIYHLKTSWYSIIGPFMLGYILGGKKIDSKIIKVLNNLGLAFQLKDDILGIFGDAKTIGKSNTSDISEFKQTILYSHIITTEYKEEFLKIYGQEKITKKDLENIRNLLIKSGSLDYANNMLHDLYDTSYIDIDDLKIKNEGKNILKGLLIYLNIRDK